MDGDRLKTAVATTLVRPLLLRVMWFLRNISSTISSLCACAHIFNTQHKHMEWLTSLHKMRERERTRVNCTHWQSQRKWGKLSEQQGNDKFTNTWPEFYNEATGISCKHASVHTYKTLFLFSDEKRINHMNWTKNIYFRLVFSIRFAPSTL